MKKKHFREFIKNRDAGNVRVGVIGASTAVVAVIWMTLLSNAASEQSRNFDLEVAVQHRYEQRVDEAARAHVFDRAMEMASGELPQDYDIIQSKEDFLAQTSEYRMGNVRLTTEDRSRHVLDERLLGGLMGIMVGGLVGFAGGAAAGAGIEFGIKKLQDRINKKEEEEAKRLAEEAGDEIEPN